jgi:hypothetical protein
MRVCRLVKRCTKTGGRKKGTPNKVTTALKDALMASFDEVGGAQCLLDLAKSDPRPTAGSLRSSSRQVGEAGKPTRHRLPQVIF